MINWDKSAELNSCTVECLKARLDKHPKARTRVIRICNGCNEEQEIGISSYRDLCPKCSHATPEFRNAMRLIGIERYSDPNEREIARSNAIKQFSTIEGREAISKAKLKEKKPMHRGEKQMLPENKNSTAFLGLVAEDILSETYEDVQRMPYGNHGYDFVCNKNYKMDVKSSSTFKNRYWQFMIRKNMISDFFLCIAFSDREHLNPIHLWLIPNHVVSHLTILSIHESTLHKWAEYEQPLDQVLICCDKMKSNIGSV